MINFRFIANLMGRLLLIESAFLLLCVLIALIHGDQGGIKKSRCIVFTIN